MNTPALDSLIKLAIYSGEISEPRLANNAYSELAQSKADYSALEEAHRISCETILTHLAALDAVTVANIEVAKLNADLIERLSTLDDALAAKTEAVEEMATCPECYEKEPDIDQLRSDNAALLKKVDEAIAWHEGDCSPHALLEHELACLQKAVEEATIDLAQLRSQIAELEAERKWRPIETAPKDGTSILLWDEFNEIVGSYYAESWMAEGNYVVPTHWMPLPPSPKEEK